METVYAVSKAHGFEEPPINIDQKLLLIVGELTEAQEELRAGCLPTLVYTKGGKPEGFGVELADAAIRLFNLAQSLGIDLEALITLKHKYNASRPYKHGKEF